VDTILVSVKRALAKLAQAASDARLGLENDIAVASINVPSIEGSD
jgi:hypothetical protein